MVLVRQINNIRIEKIRPNTSYKKKMVDGKFKTITKKGKVVYQAISPTGKILYESKKLKLVNSYAKYNTMFKKNER
jgi:hypothetical protein